MIVRLVAGLLTGLSLWSGQDARAQSSSPLALEGAPPAWVGYAEEVNASIMDWLADGSEPSLNVVAWFGGPEPTGETLSPVLARLWVDSSGVVERVVLDREADAAAQSAFRDALVGRRLSRPPPTDMPLPLRLELGISRPTPAEGP